eukprot:16014780-Heterocapsa_arctica.AAC.1
MVDTHNSKISGRTDKINMEGGARMDRRTRRRKQIDHQGEKGEEDQEHHEEAGQNKQWTQTSKDIELIEAEDKMRTEHEGQDWNTDHEGDRSAERLKIRVKFSHGNEKHKTNQTDHHRFYICKHIRMQNWHTQAQTVY